MNSLCYPFMVSNQYDIILLNLQSFTLHSFTLQSFKLTYMMVTDVYVGNCLIYPPNRQRHRFVRSPYFLQTWPSWDQFRKNQGTLLSKQSAMIKPCSNWWYLVKRILQGSIFKCCHASGWEADLVGGGRGTFWHFV